MLLLPSSLLQHAHPNMLIICISSTWWAITTVKTKIPLLTTIFPWAAILSLFMAEYDQSCTWCRSPAVAKFSIVLHRNSILQSIRLVATRLTTLGKSVSKELNPVDDDDDDVNLTLHGLSGPAAALIIYGFKPSAATSNQLSLACRFNFHANSIQSTWSCNRSFKQKKTYYH